MGKGKDRRGERVEDCRGRGGEKWETVRGGREGRRDM